MSNQDPPKEVSSVNAQNNDTLITIGSSSSTAIVVPPSPPNPNTSEVNNEEMNTSAGSQRSLNSRLFPFRFSRDMLLNNVSGSNTCSLTLMTHLLFVYRFFWKFDL